MKPNPPVTNNIFATPGRIFQLEWPGGAISSSFVLRNQILETIFLPRTESSKVFSFNLDINKFLSERYRLFLPCSSPFSQEANLVLFSILLATSVRPKSEARVAARYLPVRQLGTRHQDSP